MTDTSWVRTFNNKGLCIKNTVKSNDLWVMYKGDETVATSAAVLESATTLVYGTSTSSNSINTYLRGTNITLQVKKDTSINYNAFQVTANRIYCNNYCDMKQGAVVSGGNFTVNNNAYLAQKAGAKVGIGTSSPQYTLDVGDKMRAGGYVHSEHNSDDAVLLAGGGYSQGVPVRYWAKYSIYVGDTDSSTIYTKISGNYEFIKGTHTSKLGVATLSIIFPTNYYPANTLIFGNGQYENSHPRNPGPLYVTIYPVPGIPNQIQIMLSDDSSYNAGYATIYFICMG